MNRSALFTVCLVMQAAVVYAVGFAARSGCAPSTVVIGLGICFVPYAGVLWSSRFLPNDVAPRISLGAVLVLGAAFVIAPPVLSDDLYRYLWEGRVWLEGFNPYRLPPGDPALAHLRDDIWAGINNKSLASIYPPLSQVLFVALDLFGGQTWAAKLLGLFAHALATVVVGRVSAEPRASLALALNPLLLSEGALNGHLDILTGLALLITAWALAKHRVVQAAFAACVAVGLKAVGLVALPLFAHRRIALVTVALASGVLLSPLVVSRAFGDPASGPGQFATKWRGNDSGYAAVEWVTGQLLGPSTTEVVARGVVVGIVVIVAALVVRRRVPPLRAARLLMWITLLLSPQVHPWYLAWLLPLEVACGGFAGLVWSAAVLLAYAPLDRWVAEGVWDMPVWLQVLEYTAVAVALIVDPRRPSLEEGG